MKTTHLAILGVLLSSGCAGSSPSTPSPNNTPPSAPPPSAPVFTISGTVYEADSAGRRALASATVEIADSTTGAWGVYGRLITDSGGRYVSGPLTSRHYLARASKTGYTATPAVSLGYVEASRTLDFELVSPFASMAPLSVGAVSPTAGSTGGGTTVQITGTGFQSRATVAIGGAPATAYAENSTTIRITAPPHGPGAVDVVVTNPDGLAARLASGFTYASPSSFDFNGTWVGYALAHPESASRVGVRHADMDFRLAIQNNTVISVTCGGAAIAMASPPPSVTDGEFSLSGVSLTGRVVSAAEAVGTISTTACPSTRWIAMKQ
jgi:hypothetical protein